MLTAVCSFYSEISPDYQDCGREGVESLRGRTCRSLSVGNSSWLPHLGLLCLGSLLDVCQFASLLLLSGCSSCLCCMSKLLIWWWFAIYQLFLSISHSVFTLLFCLLNTLWIHSFKARLTIGHSLEYIEQYPTPLPSLLRCMHTPQREWGGREGGRGGRGRETWRF